MEHSLGTTERETNSFGKPGYTTSSPRQYLVRPPKRYSDTRRGTGGTRTIRSLPARTARGTKRKEKTKKKRKSRLGNRIDPRKQRRKRIRFIRKKTRRHLRIIRKWIREPGKEPYESHRYTGISTQSPFASFRQYLVRNLRKNSDR